MDEIAFLIGFAIMWYMRSKMCGVRLVLLMGWVLVVLYGCMFRTLLMYREMNCLVRKTEGYKVRIKLYEGHIFKYVLNGRGVRRVVTKGYYEVLEGGLIVLVFRDSRFGLGYFHRHGRFRTDTIRMLSLEEACLVVMDSCSAIRFRVKYLGLRNSDYLFRMKSPITR